MPEISTQTKRWHVHLDRYTIPTHSMSATLRWVEEAIVLEEPRFLGDEMLEAKVFFCLFFFEKTAGENCYNSLKRSAEVSK